MPIPIQKFRQRSIVFEKPVILSESLKTLMSSNHARVQLFVLKLHTGFLLTNAFLFCLDLELCEKVEKTWLLQTRFLHFFNNSRSKQNQKIPKTLL